MTERSELPRADVARSAALALAVERLRDLPHPDWRRSSCSEASLVHLSCAAVTTAVNRRARDRPLSRCDGRCSFLLGHNGLQPVLTVAASLQHLPAPVESHLTRGAAQPRPELLRRSLRACADRALPAPVSSASSARSCRARRPRAYGQRLGSAAGASAEPGPGLDLAPCLHLPNRRRPGEPGVVVPELDSSILTRFVARSRG
jgi:hypothetical protein